MSLEQTFRNPWWVVFGSTLALMVGNAPVLFFTFGVFLKPITSEFGWNRGTMSAALTAYVILGAMGTPFAGKLVDRWGVRRVTLAFIAAFSLATAALSQTPSYPLAFLLLYAVCGLVGSGQAPLPYAKAISARFEARRGLALGIAMAGVGLGTALMPQLARVLIQAFGWRGAYIGLGIVTFAVAFPGVLLFVRGPAASGRREFPTAGGRPGEALVASGMTMSEALKTSYQFWLLAIATFLVSAATNGTIAHIVPLLTDRGLSNQLATLVLTSAGLAMIGGRILSGYLVDRFFAPYVAACFFLLPLVGILFLGVGWAGVVPLLGAICVGLGLGAVIALTAFLIGRYFGLRAFGEMYGYVMAVFLFGSGLGPWLMGVCFDVTRSYNLALTGFALLLVIASLLISRLGPYIYPASRVMAKPEMSDVTADAPLAALKNPTK